jgi:hypothetical protein
MLKWVVALLLVANVGYFSWTQGYLAPLGWAQTQQHEPERLLAQIKPEVVRLLNAPEPPEKPAPTAPNAPANPAAVAVAPTPPAAPATSAPAQAEARSCWLVEGLTPVQANSLRTALTALDLPRGTWQLDEVRGGGWWIVYMGRYNNEAQLERKKNELRALNVAFSDVPAPGMSPGLALSLHATQAAAQEALQTLGRSGVRTARVVEDRPGASSFSLRLPNASAAQRDAVAGVGAALEVRALRACD